MFDICGCTPKHVYLFLGKILSVFLLLLFFLGDWEWLSVSSVKKIIIKNKNKKSTYW